MISRSLAIARIAVPSLVYRRNAPVAAVMTTPAASAITCVQFTWICPIEKPPLSVGSAIERASPPLVVQSRSIAPYRIRVSPMVATALISGPRAASAGPKTTPYPRVTAAAKATQTSQLSQPGAPACIRDHAISAPIAPTAPNAR